MPVATKAKRARKAPRTSLRAFARTLRVSHTAVEKGIRAGRLRKSISRDSKGPYIADVILARKEWTSGAGKARTNGHGPHSASLVEAQRQVAVERARGLRLANRTKRGELVVARTAEREAFEAARTVRDNILNVPARISGELAAETEAGRVHARLLAELQKALETIAGVLSE